MNPLIICLVPLLHPTIAQGQAVPPPEKRIVFLGDSITQDGRYIQMIEAALVAQFPSDKKTIIPLGLASETVSGLTEPGHAGGAFPRPDLHERLDRVLDQAKPELVVACYGMNDGIYYPLGAERKKAFQEGMIKLHDKVVAKGARIIHVTPPVFDPLPIKNHVLPAGLDKYERPFEGYNAVLDDYAKWLIGMGAEKKWTVIDLHFPMNEALAQRRKKSPSFTFSPDGVHPTVEGQAFIARVLAQTWGLKLRADGSPDHRQGNAILELIQKKQAALGPAWLSAVGHLRPGIARGLPVEQAEQQAAVFDEVARKVATMRTPGG